MSDRRTVKKLCYILVVMLVASGVCDAGGYKMRKKTTGYTVDVTLDRNPPIVAKNNITVEISNNSGAPVTDAKVLVNYFMPPMPGMPPMNYNAQAMLSGKEYKAVMDLSMAGPWNIVVKISRAGKTVSVRLPIDVR